MGFFSARDSLVDEEFFGSRELLDDNGLDWIEALEFGMGKGTLIYAMGHGI